MKFEKWRNSTYHIYNNESTISRSTLEIVLDGMLWKLEVSDEDGYEHFTAGNLRKIADYIDKLNTVGEIL